ALSTNSDVWELTLADGAVRNLSAANRAFDGAPRYSPDGKRIAWRAQSRPGFESDKYDLVVYDRAAAKSRRLTERFDDSVDDLAWLPDSRRLAFTAVRLGHKPLLAVDLEGKITPLREGVTAADPVPLADGTIVYAA